MKNVSLLLSALLICFFYSETSAQKYVTTTRQATGFNGVNISGGIDLYITQGTSASVKIEAREDIQSDIITEVKNGKLEIYFKSRDLFKWSFRNNNMKAHVTLPVLTNINASGGSDVYSQNVFKINELMLTASGGSDVKFEATGGKIDSKATGGSDMTLRGKVASFSVTASGGSDINAKDLESVKVTASASGGSDVHVYVTTELKANANGGSDIYYKGNPAKISRDSSGGSDITKKD
jgi:hypothetical protein